MPNRIALCASIVLVVVATIAFGCSSSTKPSNFDDGTGDDGGASTDGGLNNDVGSLTPDGAGDGNPSCGMHCTADLHAVVDCNGTLIRTCDADKACGSNGQCVAPCDGAKVNKSSIGCDYYSVDPDMIAEGQGACFAAYIANTWTTPITIQVERNGQMLDTSIFARVPSGFGKNVTYAPLPGGQLPAGQVAILFLAHGDNPISASNDVPCPAGITPAVTTDVATHGTAIGSAFHITTSAPVVAYDILPYGGGAAALTSATLLLPTSAWDTNYIAVNAFSKSIIAGGAGAKPSLDIVAAEDNTEVTISPTAAIVGGIGVAATGQGQPQTYVINKGQVLQITQDDELTGSPIQSNKPIALWGAASCLNIDPNTCCCDSAHQQIPPVKALGSEYALVRYRNRDDNIDESPPWRLVGAVDGTQLVWEPHTPAGAPTSLNEGQFAQFNSPGPFVVKSQDNKHPFYISGHMQGCLTYFGPDDCRGDAEFVNLVPTGQYLAQYVFFTDPTYPETNLVVTRRKGKNGFADVILDCAGAITGWQPLGTSGNLEYTRVDLVRHDFQAQGQCDNGRREIHSDVPFGVTVWGWGSKETGGVHGIPQAPGFYTQAVSYAYPAGMSVLPINDVIVPPRPR